MQFSFIFLNIIFLYLAAQLGGPRSSVVDYVMSIRLVKALPRCGDGIRIPYWTPESSRACSHTCKNTQQDRIEMAEFPPSSLQPLAQEVVELLKARRETVSVAETVRSLPRICGAEGKF
jgi:hypothetical protein